jgi:hypothetical protein
MIYLLNEWNFNNQSVDGLVLKAAQWSPRSGDHWALLYTATLG